MRTEQELKELLKKYSEGGCTAEEEILLQQWFTKIGQGQPSLELSGEDRRRMLADLIRSPRFTEQPKTAKLHYLQNWKRVAIAAAMTGVVFFSWWLINADRPNNFFPVANKEIAFVRLQTGSGEVKQVVLPDSSVVWLNARTTLSYHPDFALHREIRLSGEALFEVTRDENHPFSVLTTDSLKTTVLGTKFNIRSYDRLSETQVTVVSGRVQVAQPDKRNIMGILAHDQAIRFNRGKGSFMQTEVNATALTGWSTGHWELNNQGLEELALLLYNQYGVTVENRRKGLEALHVDVNFTNRQTAREIVTVFSMLAGCRYKWIDNNRVELY